MQLISYSRPQDSNVGIHQLKVATRCNTIDLKILHKLASVRRPNKRHIICQEMGKDNGGALKNTRNKIFWTLICLIKDMIFWIVFWDMHRWILTRSGWGHREWNRESLGTNRPSPILQTVLTQPDPRFVVDKPSLARLSTTLFTNNGASLSRRITEKDFEAPYFLDEDRRDCKWGVFSLLRSQNGSLCL